MKNLDYKFIPEEVFETIKSYWKIWDAEVRPEKYVVGISGGVDSTCVAALACKIFGKDKVIGVSLPCDGQKDMWAVDKVFDVLGIKRVTIDIGDMFNVGLNAIENQAIEMTSACRTNMPARIRMTMLFGVAQCVDGAVLNTCNWSETSSGWDTLFGDSAGSYAPIKDLVKTEVMALCSWLGMPDDIAYKTPIDGLQPLTDEQSFGYTYAELDRCIRMNGGVSEDVVAKIRKRYFKNRFKHEIINVPGPVFEYPDVTKIWDNEVQ